MRSKKILSLFIGVLIILGMNPLSTFADGKDPVRIIEQSIIVFPKDLNTVEIVQITNFKNNGTTKESKLPIYLPEDYSNLQLGEGLVEENMEITEKGFIDTTGLNAGEEKRILVTYQMPMNEKVSQWKIEQSYVTEKLQVIIQPGILSFTASDLVTQSDLFEMNGQNFRRFTKLNTHPGEPWSLSFRLIADVSNGTEQAEQAESTNSGGVIKKQKVTDDGIRIIGQEGIGYGKASLTIAIIIIAFSAALIGLKRDLQKTMGIKNTMSPTWLKTEKGILLEELFQLETDYRSNLIGDKTYELTKKKLREQLIQVSTELKKRALG